MDRALCSAIAAGTRRARRLCKKIRILVTNPGRTAINSWEGRNGRPTTPDLEASMNRFLAQFFAVRAAVPVRGARRATLGIEALEARETPTGIGVSNAFKHMTSVLSHSNISHLPTAAEALASQNSHVSVHK
jgi:hypothetical protein